MSEGPGALVLAALILLVEISSRRKARNCHPHGRFISSLDLSFELETVKTNHYLPSPPACAMVPQV